jgi:hypothetical protein
MKKVFDETFNYYRIPNIYWDYDSDEETYDMYTYYEETHLWSDTNINEKIYSSGAPVILDFARSEISASTANVAKYSTVFFYGDEGNFYTQTSNRDYHRLITTEKLTEGVYVINFSFQEQDNNYKSMYTPVNYSDIFVITDTSQLYKETVCQRYENSQAFEEFYIYNNEIYIRMRFDNVKMEWDEDDEEYNWKPSYSIKDIRIVIYKL